MPQPRLSDFALLYALEASVRGLLLSAIPLAMYRAWGEGTVVSAFYLAAGTLSLLAGLLVPWASRRVPRGRLTVAAGGLFLLAQALLIADDPWLLPLAILVMAVGTVTIWNCLSAYVLDWVAREDFGRMETRRLQWSAAPWTLGPITGVLLLDWWHPAPFLLAGLFALLFVLAFLRLGLGAGKAVGAARGRPLAFLRRFASRPRLVAGWSFATIRSCGWWVYIVYLPLFCRETGLDERVAGAAVSLTNVLLLLTPLMLRLVGRLTVRGAVRLSFGAGAALFVLSALASPVPWATVALLLLASATLVMLDVCGSLPFLLAVKPSERTEMAAVYTSFRDVSGILSPLGAGLILLVAPAAAVFGAMGLGMGVAWAVAARLHPRLGEPRPALAPPGSAPTPAGPPRRG